MKLLFPSFHRWRKLSMKNYILFAFTFITFFCQAQEVKFHTMKHIYLFLLLFISSTSMAQNRKNTILIGTGMLHIPNSSPYVYILPELNSFSYISYERKLTSKFGIGLNYAQWKNHYGAGNCPYEVTYSVAKTLETYKVDLIHPIQRTKYRFYDLTLNYSFLDKKKHALSANIGLGMANGWNYYITNIVKHYQNHISVFYSPLKNETYWGGCANVRYNMLFFKQRLLLGVNAKYSYYHNAFSQLNYTLVTGFNF